MSPQRPDPLCPSQKTGDDPATELAGDRRLGRLLRKAAGGDRDLEATIEARLATFVREASRSTVSSWASGVERWLTFCDAAAVTPISPRPAAVVAFIEQLQQGSRFATIQSRVWAVCRLHVMALRPSPTLHPSVEQALDRVRTRPEEAGRQAKGVTPEALKAMLEATPRFSGLGFRDRAMIRVAFDAQPTGAQLVGIDVEHVVALPGRAGLVVLRSRGAGQLLSRRLTVETISAVGAWTAFAGLTQGPLFRAIDRWGNMGARLQPRQLEQCVRRLAAAAGLGDGWGILSLRSRAQGG